MKKILLITLMALGFLPSTVFSATITLSPVGGDNLANMTAQISQLVQLGGGTLYLSGNLYQISDTLEIPSCITLTGDDCQKTTIESTNKMAHVLTISGNRVTIENLTLRHVSPYDASGNPIAGYGLGADGICVTGKFNARIINCDIYNNNKGISVYGSFNTDGSVYPVYFSRIEKCSITNNLTWGIFAIGMQDPFFDSNMIFGNGNNADNISGGGVYFASCVGPYSHSNHIHNNFGPGLFFDKLISTGNQKPPQHTQECFFSNEIIDANRVTGIDILNGQRIHMVNCRIGYCGVAMGGAAGSGCTIRSTSNNVIISNCEILGNKKHGIEIQGAHDININCCQIYGNGLDSAQSSGIFASGSWRDVQLTNNRCMNQNDPIELLNSQYYGICAQGGSNNLMVVNNNCSGNISTSVKTNDVNTSVSKVINSNF